MVGSYFHDAPSPPITKIGWHPWGENGSTLMILTADGVIRYGPVICSIDVSDYN
jgi:nucleoporin NUP82